MEHNKAQRKKTQKRNVFVEQILITSKNYKKCKCGPFFLLQPSNSKRFLPRFGHSLEPLSFPKWQSVWVLADKAGEKPFPIGIHEASPGDLSCKDTCFKNLSVLCVNKTGDHPLWLTFSSADTTSGYNVSCLWNTVDFLPPLFFSSLMSSMHVSRSEFASRWGLD